MKTNIQIFNNEQFGEVRVAKSENGEPLFCLADVCKILELRQGDVKQRLDEGVVSTQPLMTAGGKQLANFVNEDGLYDVVLDSKKPIARQLRKWVTSEILPTIRKHGGYLTPQKIEEALLNPDTIIQLATNLKEEKRKRAILEAENERKEQTIKDQAPKVLFAQAVEGSQSSCLIGELAKIISQNGVEIGQNRLFQWLRENKYLVTHGEYRNIPMQKYIEQGLFILKKGVRSGNSGELHTTVTPKVTGKGQTYFINKFLNKQAPITL